MAEGQDVDEALEIKNTDIVNELSLPPVKIHCSVLAEDAIKAAISDYKKKQTQEGAGRSRRWRKCCSRNSVSRWSRSRPKAVAEDSRRRSPKMGVAGWAASGRARRRLLGPELSVQVRYEAARRPTRSSTSTACRFSSIPRACCYLDGMTLD